MTSANNGYNCGAGGKLRKKVLRKTGTTVDDLYEIEHLTTYRYEIDEGDKANISKNSLVLRLKESKSGFKQACRGRGGKLQCFISIPRAGKRRSSVQDDLGYGGPMRRIRQKAERCSQVSSLSKHKSEFDSSAQRLLLCSEPEQKASKAIVENREISMRNSGYAFVPTVSTQMASKILEHLERTIPKEKPSSSRLARTTEKSATKLTSNLALGSRDKVESSKFLLSSQNNQKSEGQHRIEENGPQRFAVPLIVLSSMNGNSTAPTTNAPSTLALPAEPPQKKPAF
ncbi:hypothetical protein Tco_0747674 [Tanacetum coccineum]|uniref:Uncharacterized protein n=1 Tax=Tanacetum coccineum TaxID=301880 RepID=A0ABQ4YTD3_9ASTR